MPRGSNQAPTARSRCGKVAATAMAVSYKLAFILVVCSGACLGFVSTSAADSGGYYRHFRSTYGPVQAGLGPVGNACGYGRVTSVAQLPACGRRVAPFRRTVASLLRFLTQTTPPAKVKADVGRAVRITKVLQLRFATLASIIARKDLARFKAMSGTGRPIDDAITAFNTALDNLYIDLT